MDAKNGRCGIRQGGLGLVAGKEYIGYAIVRHAGKPAPVEVRLAGGPKEADGQSVSLSDVGDKYSKFAFRFRSGASVETASLSLTVSQEAQLRLPRRRSGGRRAEAWISPSRSPSKLPVSPASSKPPR